MCKPPMQSPDPPPLGSEVSARPAVVPAVEYAAFVLPTLVGWLCGSHMLPFAVYTAYWAMHRAGLQHQYQLWLRGVAERYQ